MYTYLILNILTISFPLIRSFENRINYVSKWGYIFPAIILTGAFFVVWDHIFTDLGVWSFNEKYITGIYFLILPIEEWLFFLTVPFACMFIYEVLQYFVKQNPLEKISRPLSYILIAVFIISAILFSNKLYTSVNFFLCGIFLAIHLAVYKTRYLGMFYLTYLVHLAPFLLVNGVLTYLPVVEYNNAENLGIRVFTIPLEDFGYSFLLLLMNISIYETVKEKFSGLVIKPKASQKIEI
jgi:lycopene cyclase domain-containing protein